MPSIRRVLAEALAVFLALNCGIDAIAAVLAHGGRFSPLLDILSHFAVIYLVSALAGMTLALFLRNWGRPVALGLGGVAVVASLALMAPEMLRPEPPRAPAGTPGQIKVIQFNTLRTNAEIGPIVDWLVAQDPDIVTVTEARHDLRDLLVKRTGWQVAGAHGSLMIFSRKPRLSMDRPKPAGGVLHFVNATYPSDSGSFEVVTAHFGWPTTSAHLGTHRVLAAVVRARPGERMILTGDFNSAPWSAALRRTDARLGLARRTRGVLTYPADRRGFRWPYPVLPIDHIYAGPGWATVKVERGPRLGSDHYPVIVTLAPVAPR